LLNYALRFIPLGRAALLFATMPLLTMVFAAARGHEQLTVVKIAGVLLTVLGVGVALGERAVVHGGAPTPWIGDLAVLASAASGALCTVFYQPFLQRYPTLPVSAVAMLAAVAFLTALAVPEGFFRSPPPFAAAGWLAVLFIGFSSGVGYFLWLWALHHTTPTRVTVFLALSPVTAAGLGASLLGEQVSTAFGLGLACVALGLWLAHR
jgi:drug/metabolite transporter (DMT)-like permease